MRIIGYLFDTYTVSIEAAPDVLKPLARGDVDEAERGLLTRADEAREIRKRQRKDEDESSKPRRTRKPKVRWSKFDTVFINQHGRDRTTPQRRAYSEMRERIEQMKADARGRLKNKKNEE